MSTEPQAGGPPGAGAQPEAAHTAPPGARPGAVLPQPPGGERSVTVGAANHAPVTTGDHSPITAVTVGSLPPVADVPPAAGPVGLDAQARQFVGRTRELAVLEQALSGGRGAVVQAVHGLGGIGKSALAAQYVALHAREFTQVVWLTAEDGAGVEAGLRRLAIALEPQLDRFLSSEALAERAVAWLAAHDGWLLVLDNVTAMRDISALLERLGGGGGRFLATSRRAVGWQRIGATPVRLDVLAPDEALALLGRTVGAAAQTLDGGDELCAQLGHLPLAIVQAGGYIAQNGLTARAYLALLAEQSAHLYATGDEDTDPGRTIARTWRLILDRLAADDPLPGRILRVLAWFAPDGIPAGLLNGLAPQPGLGEALGKLAAYNMLTRGGDPEEPLLAVHRLVQAVSRTSDPADPHRTPELVDEARARATRLLIDAAPRQPGSPATWPVWRRLLPHVLALADHTSPETDTLTTCRLLGLTGEFLQDQGDLPRAIDQLSRTYDSDRRLQGADSPSTMISLNNLALAHEGAGHLQRAIELHERNLADRLRILGPDHPNTLTSRNNLGYTYREAGDLDRALPLLEQNLEDRLRILGPDHANTLVSRNNLALAYRSAGDLDRSIALHEHNLAERVRVLGPDHPNTLGSRTNLADAYHAKRDLDRAIPQHEQLVADSERVLGPDHPTTLIARNNLATAYRSAGQVDRALAMHEQILAARLRILGPDHPNTLNSRNNLASTVRATGDVARAAALFEPLLADVERALGADHPQTRTVRDNLDSARRRLADLARRAQDPPA
ncbi:tetratricopeptide repeat protein [Actinacidiphila bryophytorum]|uniref:Tetratricopeptide repeat protein n=1 Tax=Actinacidiphila bryophytorum TaxID=1436133 RepID=A0A9W4MHA4_9ACTN|nr:tetratricopeptide repeat protein [Actinacidiphila bryophytorum]MBM9435107.1 tetratricopeptide repeat protein [Actinacidiphila bryophytorum]MBN6546157.1 tetratricopeptide repeat protein [Actinacidiphila bryophytorum]CAG7643160.1 Tetratricopeptide repeat protein [Actinacidiphila bryophytorum]